MKQIIWFFSNAKVVQDKPWKNQTDFHAKLIENENILQVYFLIYPFYLLAHKTRTTDYSHPINSRLCNFLDVFIREKVKVYGVVTTSTTYCATINFFCNTALCRRYRWDTHLWFFFLMSAFFMSTLFKSLPVKAETIDFIDVNLEFQDIEIQLSVSLKVVVLEIFFYWENSGRIYRIEFSFLD